MSREERKKLGITSQPTDFWWQQKPANGNEMSMKDNGKSELDIMHLKSKAEFATNNLSSSKKVMNSLLLLLVILIL